MKTQNDIGMNRVTVALAINGDAQNANRIRQQIVHYAQSLPGVKVV